MGAKLYVSRAAPHMWEEPCISGTHGSGTVFFSGCSLLCVYCQNNEISRGISGKEINTDRLCDIFFELKKMGCHNINLVTPDHFAEHILQAVKLAKSKGINIPFVYNTSGYCAVETLKEFRGLIDIYLTDFKYITPEISAKYSSCPNYGAAAEKALSEMIFQCGKTAFNGNLMTRGVIVRHLCLPHNISESKRVLDALSKYKNDIYLSIMNQYTPVKMHRKFPELNRRLKMSEYNRVLTYAEKTGFENVFIQEGGTAEESFIPQFDSEGV